MFPGFPPEGLKFLRALKRNNDREWFQARKETFDTKVMEPMLALIDEVNQGLFKFAPDHATPPKKAVYRIYRDTRFSNDKTPYKTHIAAIFPRKGLPKHASAGFYFQISPENVGFAAGAYMPGPEELLAVRKFITANHTEFAAACKKAAKTCGELGGSALVRSPKGFDPEHAAAELVRKKQWFFWKEMKPDLAGSPKVAAEIVKYFQASTPIVNMLNVAFTKTKKQGGSIRDLMQ